MHSDLLFPSKYIRAADLMDKPKQEASLTICGLEREELRMQDNTTEEKWCLHFKEWEKRPPDERKRLVLNKTNAGTISEVLGTETEEWVDKSITLFATTCSAFGQTVDCIRVRGK